MIDDAFFLSLTHLQVRRRLYRQRGPFHNHVIRISAAVKCAVMSALGLYVAILALFSLYRLAFGLDNLSGRVENA